MEILPVVVGILDLVGMLVAIAVGLFLVYALARVTTMGVMHTIRSMWSQWDRETERKGDNGNGGQKKPRRTAGGKRAKAGRVGASAATSPDKGEGRG